MAVDEQMGLGRSCCCNVLIRRRISPAEERFLLAAYYLDHRTLAELAKLQGVHESTISRKLERITAGARKRVRKRLMQAGMSARQADEAMEDVDVRDLRVRVSETLQQGRSKATFYKEKGEPQE